ncbi:hypothetical protein N7457_007750 [Penicillium paradoxum]|uniref:uncharacterized protein n=1 Tax=Penicillium paradoxum TaxID=176176 RepID=UPI0025487FB6|nr:uncharacterized protein N7457_007750 [Penicillium paradoxum]KAJ5772854.1 hypothetical protein N7457_007750 [Penicillium paradoxum]
MYELGIWSYKVYHCHPEESGDVYEYFGYLGAVHWAPDFITYLRRTSLGWILVCLLDQCVAFSLAELASRYPTSAGPYYWSFQISQGNKTTISFINAWIWLVDNWTITLSVNFGFASMLSATISLYHPTRSASSWQLLLTFYAVCLASLIVCIFANKYLPQPITILGILLIVSIKPHTPRHSPSYTLSHYDKSFAGWGNFTFLIGLLPAAYTFSAIGMISSMAEECSNPAIKVPRTIALSVPVGGTAGLFFIIPLCATLPPLQDIISNVPDGQALPYILARIMGSPGGGLGLVSLVLPSRYSARSALLSPRHAPHGPLPVTMPYHFRGFGRASIRAGMLLGLINLGSSSAFTAFVSVGVITLAAAYAIPIFLSLWYGREEVGKAPWNCGRILGPVVNVIALPWISFELVLFSMPTVLPVTPVSMNYASVVFVGFMAISVVWFLVYARKSYKGPPESDALD